MKPLRLLFVSIFFLILAVLLSEFSDRISNKTRFARNVEQKIQTKKEKVRILFHRLDKNEDTFNKIIEKANRQGIILIRYKKNELTF